MKIHLEDVRGALVCEREKKDSTKTVAYPSELYKLWRYGADLSKQVVCLNCFEKVAYAKKHIDIDCDTDPELVQYIAARSIKPVVMY